MLVLVTFCLPLLQMLVRLNSPEHRKLILRCCFVCSWRFRRYEFESNIAKMDADETEINALRRRYHMRELQRMRYQLKRFTTNDFESLAVVGKGAFGEVWDHVSTLYVFLYLFTHLLRRVCFCVTLPTTIYTIQPSRRDVAHAQVRLVRKKDTGEIFATKTMVKAAMIRKKQVLISTISMLSQFGLSASPPSTTS